MKIAASPTANEITFFPTFLRNTYDSSADNFYTHFRPHTPALNAIYTLVREVDE
jgi:hypothetical protein